MKHVPPPNVCACVCVFFFFFFLLFLYTEALGGKLCHTET